MLVSMFHFSRADNPVVGVDQSQLNHRRRVFDGGQSFLLIRVESLARDFLIVRTGKSCRTVAQHLSQGALLLEAFGLYAV